MFKRFTGNLLTGNLGILIFRQMEYAMIDDRGLMVDDRQNVCPIIDH
jgi:hypothetical protein